MASANPLNVLKTNIEEITLESTEEQFEVEEAIEEIIAASPVLIFMKGNSDAPKCGFSANAVAIMNKLSVDYCTFDVLTHPAIREGIKKYSNWPTIPQVYINGEFVGGSELLADLYQNGKLRRLINGSR